MGIVTSPPSPDFPFAGKWSFNWADDRLPLMIFGITAFSDPYSSCILQIDQFGYFGGGTPLNVYGNPQNGVFQLASPDGLPLNFVGMHGSVPNYLCNASTFATFEGVVWGGGNLYHYTCNKQGRLTCPVNNNNNYLLNIDPSYQAHDLFQAVSQAPGLSEIKSNGGVNCDLSCADLSKADLSGVDLSGANLRRANLSGAILTNTTFTGATLTNADFTDAKLDGARFVDCDTSQAKFSPGVVLRTAAAPSG